MVERDRASPFEGVVAILVAAGRGERAGGGRPKQFLLLEGRMLFVHSLAALAASAEVDGTVLVVPSGWEKDAEAAVAAAGLRAHVVAIVPGGATRQESVDCGLRALAASEPDLPAHVLVHDAARPFITQSLIARTIEAARRHGAATAALPITDTLMRARPADGDSEPGRLAAEVVGRAGVWAVQTPQVFELGLLRAAHEEAGKTGFEASDDGTLVLRLGRHLAFVPGDWWNIKVTEPEDLERARRIAESEARRPMSQEGPER